MRVTEVSKREQVLENIQKTSARLQDAQIQMATGQRINKPSDDPIGTAVPIGSSEGLLILCPVAIWICAS